MAFSIEPSCPVAKYDYAFNQVFKDAVQNLRMLNTGHDEMNLIRRSVCMSCMTVDKSICSDMQQIPVDFIDAQEADPKYQYIAAGEHVDEYFRDYARGPTFGYFKHSSDVVYPERNFAREIYNSLLTFRKLFANNAMVDDDVIIDQSFIPSLLMLSDIKLSYCVGTIRQMDETSATIIEFGMEPEHNVALEPVVTALNAVLGAQNSGDSSLAEKKGTLYEEALYFMGTVNERDGIFKYITTSSDTCDPIHDQRGDGLDFITYEMGKYLMWYAPLKEELKQPRQIDLLSSVDIHDNWELDMKMQMVPHGGFWRHPFFEVSQYGQYECRGGIILEMTYTYDKTIEVKTCVPGEDIVEELDISEFDLTEWATFNIKHVFDHAKQNFVMKVTYDTKTMEFDMLYPVMEGDFDSPGDTIGFQGFVAMAYPYLEGDEFQSDSSQMPAIANVWFRSWETESNDDEKPADNTDDVEDNWCPEYASWDDEKERCTLNDEYFELRKCNLENGNMGFEFFRSKSFEKLYKLAEEPGDKVFQYDFNDMQYNQYDSFDAFELADEQRKQYSQNSEHYFSMITEDEKVTLIYCETFKSPEINGVFIHDDVYLRFACEYDFGLITLDSSYDVVKTDIHKEAVQSYSYHKKQGTIPYTISTAGKLKVGAPVTFTISPRHPGKFFGNLHSCEVQSNEDKVELYPKCESHFAVEYYQPHGSQENLTLTYNAFRFASPEHKAQTQKLVCVIDVQMKSPTDPVKVCSKK